MAASHFLHCTLQFSFMQSFHPDIVKMPIYRLNYMFSLYISFGISNSVLFAYHATMEVVLHVIFIL